MDMIMAPPPDRARAAQPKASDLVRIETLYEAGRLYDAWRATLSLAPIGSWRDPEAMIIGGRLAHYTGAPRLSDAIMLRAWRQAPRDANARYYGIRCVLTRRGPLAALAAMEQYDAPAGDAETRAKWMAQRAQVFGYLRDFGEAEASIAEAKRLAPGHPWIALDGAHLLELQDRCEDALADVRHVLAITPHLHSATLATAHLLVLLGHDDEAIAFLINAQKTLQSGQVSAMLAALLTERGRYQEALEAWELCRIYLPLAEKETRASLYANLSHLQYLVGNLAESKRLAIESGEPMLARLAERLGEDGSKHRRLQHNVPFIRQHHVTCAPTTIAMIGRHWGIDVEHLAVAEEITYGGTTAHDERVWAETNGWRVKEFTVTWDAAVALLDRGMPFTLNTIFVGVGHAQAVIGYDTHRRTLLLRDPSSPGLSEGDAEQLLAMHAAVGPRGMVVVPRAKAALLDEVTLPEEHERDLLHRTALALDRHDRDGAMHALRELNELGRGPIALWARHMIASYDQNVEEALAATDELLALYPGSATLLMQKQSYLLFLGRHEERLALLEEASRQKEADPALLRTYADALTNDGTDLEKAARAIRRYLRMAPLDAQGLRVQANTFWMREQFAPATRLYRFASCLSDTDESLATSYFIASTATGRQDDALALLRDRYERFGHRSGLPAKTLFWALTQLHQLDEAFAVLAHAIDLRPNDGELLLAAADAYARYGSHEEAERLLARAEKNTRQAEYFATLAAVRGYRGELAASLEAWRRVHELQPLQPEAHQAIRSLLLQTSGRAAARAFCEELVRRFPKYTPAHAQLVDELRADEDDAALEQAALRHLAQAPHDAWAHRTLAQALSGLGRHHEALAACERATVIEPTLSSNFVVRAQSLARAGRLEEAKQSLRKAVELFPDDMAAWGGFNYACATTQERAEELTRLYPHAVARSVTGDAIGAIYQVAVDVIEGTRLLALLRDAVVKRPLVAQCRVALVHHLLRLRKNADAVVEAEEALRRMPLNAAVRVAAAEAYAASGDATRQAEALEAALRIDPSSSTAASSLAALLQKQGQNDRALAVLRDASARTPLDPDIQYALSEALWQADKRDESLERLGRAASIAPDNGFYWQLLRDRGTVMERPDAGAQVAAQLVRDRPRSGVAWVAMAQADDDATSQLAAVEQAIAVDPQYETAYHIKAQILAGAGRFPEALAACEGWANVPAPYGLRARAAWVQAQSGDLQAAIAAMKAIVKDHADFAWAWHQLAQWYAATGQPGPQRKAAQELVRLTPDEPVGWNELGLAQKNNNNFEATETAWRRSLELDPANLYAGLNLCDLLLEQGRADDAAGVLSSLSRHTSDPLIQLREIDLARLRGTTAGAISALRKLLVDPNAGVDLVNEALRRVLEMKPGDDLLQLFQHVSRQPALTIGGASAAAGYFAGEGRWKDAFSVIDKVRDQGEAGVSAATALLDAVARTRDQETLRRFIDRYRGWALATDELWGMVGYALRMQGDKSETITWLFDWKQRLSAEPWMLLNLTIALRYTGRDAEAAEVAAGALQLEADGATPAHQVWSAFDHARDGDIAGARALMEGVDREALDGLHQLFASLVDAIILGATEPHWIRAANPYLAPIAALRASGDTSLLLKRSLRQSVRTIHRLRGGLLALLWRASWVVRG